MPDEMFLTAEEVAKFTDIRKGKNGKTREQLQCEHLRSIGIPFFPSACGAPKIARCFFDNAAPPPAKKTAWVPRVLSANS
jgi:hypothetical protein